MHAQNPVFIPGPTNMPDAIRRACDVATIDHRSPAFAAMLNPAIAGVKRVLNMAAGEVFVLPSTGTGGWEAAITNTLSAGDTVLAARFGMFSHRWIDMCQRHGLNVEILETPWGNGMPLDRIEAALRADTGHRIKAVLATHNETATGVRSDMAGLRAAMDSAGHPALLMVDGVSSIASMPFEFTGWGVDIAVAGSQKGFMLPAGLAILGLSPRALAAMDSATLPRTYFDLRDQQKGYAAGGYPYTPPVGLIAGLAHAVTLLEARSMSLPATPGLPRACAARSAPGGWSCARPRQITTPTPSPRSWPPRGSTALRWCNWPRRNTASPLAWAWARWRASCSASAIWA